MVKYLMLLSTVTVSTVTVSISILVGCSGAPFTFDPSFADDASTEAQDNENSSHKIPDAGNGDIDSPDDGSNLLDSLPSARPDSSVRIVDSGSDNSTKDSAASDADGSNSLNLGCDIAEDAGIINVPLGTKTCYAGTPNLFTCGTGGIWLATTCKNGCRDEACF